MTRRSRDRRSVSVHAIGLVAVFVLAGASGSARGAAQAALAIDLADLLAAGGISTANRDVTTVPGGGGVVQLSEKAGPGVAWIRDTDFGTGSIEVDVKGRDVMQRSFVGVAFHGQDPSQYEAVYLRPFNFRASDPVRHQHAVQYMAAPGHDWPRLRKEFPEEFENPVDASIDPNGWVRLRLDVTADRVAIFVGPAASPTLEVRRLGTAERGMIGLWVGNMSDGQFRNLRITPAR